MEKKHNQQTNYRLPKEIQTVWRYSRDNCYEHVYRHNLKCGKRYLWSWALIMSTRSWAVTLSLWVYIRDSRIFIACLTRFWTNLRSKNLFSFPALPLHLESSNCLKNHGKLLCFFFYLETKLQEKITYYNDIFQTKKWNECHSTKIKSQISTPFDPK